MAEAQRQSGGSRMDAAVAYATLRTALAAFEQPPVELDETQLAEVETIVMRELVIADAVLESERAQVVTVAETEVADAVLELQKRYPSKKDFTLDLARHSLDLRGLKQALARELKVAAVMEQVGLEAPIVGDDEVRWYYDNNQVRYSYPETREARHILVTINDDYPENRREEAWRRIQDIAGRVGTNAERFAEQALKHSECPTSIQQGRLGRLRPGQLFSELDKALFALNEGDIVGPVETEIGFHLLYCETIYPAGTIGFEQAKEKIRDELQNYQIQRYQRAWMASLNGSKMATKQDG